MAIIFCCRVKCENELYISSIDLHEVEMMLRKEEDDNK
jgi:hypothetical protein